MHEAHESMEQTTQKQFVYILHDYNNISMHHPVQNETNNSILYHILCIFESESKVEAYNESEKKEQKKYSLTQGTSEHSIR